MLCILIAHAAIKIEDFKEIIAILVFPGPCVGPLCSLTKESWRPFSSTFHLNRKQFITTNEKAMVGDTDNVLLQVAAQVQGPLFIQIISKHERRPLELRSKEILQDHSDP